MIQSVGRALDILMTVSDMRGEPVTLGTIAQKTGIHASTCAHLVQTLCEKGFLSQVSRTSGYILGAYAYYLTRYKTFHKELIETCNPALKWIQRRTGPYRSAGNSCGRGEICYQLRGGQQISAS